MSNVQCFLVGLGAFVITCGIFQGLFFAVLRYKAARYIVGCVLLVGAVVGGSWCFGDIICHLWGKQ